MLESARRRAKASSPVASLGTETGAVVAAGTGESRGGEAGGGGAKE